MLPPYSSGQFDPVLHAVELAVWHGIGAMIEKNGDYNEFLAVMFETYKDIEHLPSPLSVDDLQRKQNPPLQSAHVVDVSDAHMYAESDDSQLVALQLQLDQQCATTDRLQNELFQATARQAVETETFQRRIRELESLVQNAPISNNQGYSPDVESALPDGSGVSFFLHF